MERPEERDSHYVKRVTLPSGRTIEVVYFKDPAERETSLRPATESDHPLHVCTCCGSGLVYPTTWEEEGEAWNVVMRCPECEAIRSGTFTQDAVEAFDDELDAGTSALLADYRRLCRSNMAEEADRLVAALDAGAILPEDF